MLHDCHRFSLYVAAVYHDVNERAFAVAAAAAVAGYLKLKQARPSSSPFDPLTSRG
jgi:hypothetical protein